MTIQIDKIQTFREIFSCYIESEKIQKFLQRMVNNDYCDSASNSNGDVYYFEICQDRVHDLSCEITDGVADGFCECDLSTVEEIEELMQEHNLDRILVESK